MGHWQSLSKTEDYIGMDFYGQRNLIQWYPDGRVIVKLHSSPIKDIWGRAREGAIDSPPKSKGVYSSWSNRSRINYCMPGGATGYEFFSYYYHTMIKRKSMGTSTARECPEIIIFESGKILNKNDLGLTYGQIRRYYEREHYQRHKPRRRGLYWINRARNLYLDNSKCKGRGDRFRHSCDVRRHGRGTVPGTRECGCRLFRKNIGFRYKAQQILAESNVTVRSAWIRLYGVEKFFTDIRPSIVDTLDKYQLLQINMPDGTVSRALRMECPSTGRTYVILVPRNLDRVTQAVDWMKGTRNFLDRVAQHT